MGTDEIAVSNRALQQLAISVTRLSLSILCPSAQLKLFPCLGRSAADSSWLALLLDNEVPAVAVVEMIPVARLKVLGDVMDLISVQSTTDAVSS